MATLTAKKLIVHAEELNHPEGSQYTFAALEFSNGLVLIPSTSDMDWFFSCPEDIQANGSAVVTEVEDTGETEDWDSAILIELAQESANYYDNDDHMAAAKELCSR